MAHAHADTALATITHSDNSLPQRYYALCGATSPFATRALYTYRAHAAQQRAARRERKRARADVADERLGVRRAAVAAAASHLAPHAAAAGALVRGISSTYRYLFASRHLPPFSCLPNARYLRMRKTCTLAPGAARGRHASCNINIAVAYLSGRWERITGGHLLARL